MASDPGPAISVLQLRIALRGLSPPVWRRVLIPESITLARLHGVIQAAMGWTDDHLHQFIIRGRRYGESREGALQFSTAATALQLSAFALREHEAFFYVYDFNAWWRHDIRVERRVPAQHIELLPRCVAGSGACPPEDIGGVEPRRASARPKSCAANWRRHAARRVTPPWRRRRAARSSKPWLRLLGAGRSARQRRAGAAQ
ncbi:plasmid pRiA4b ORF-3 family protein, partial [Cupriavidus sp. TA19]